MSEKQLMTVNEIIRQLGVSREVVLRWINKGYLPALKSGKGGKHDHYLIHEEDLKAFLSSEHYGGHPEDIPTSRPFTKVPDIEKCYPANLVRAALGRQACDESENLPPTDIWEVDFVRFRKFIDLLTDQEQKIISMRYRFGFTLDECGKALAVTRERVRQVEARFLRKLRHAIIKEHCFIVRGEEHEALKKEIEKLTEENVQLKSKIVDDYVADLMGPEEPQVDLNKINIEDLDFSVRSYNCLKRRYINTLADILAYDQNQHEEKIGNDGKLYCPNTWKTIRNLGRKSLEEVAKKTFALTGYRLRYYDEVSHTYTSFVDIPGVPQTLSKLEEVK